jgi:hypothetical protein
MAISWSNERGEMLFTDQAQQAELYAKVEPLLRQGLGVPMVQHPTEFMWDKGVGAREFEYVLWFGPGRPVQSQPVFHARGRPLTLTSPLPGSRRRVQLDSPQILRDA